VSKETVMILWRPKIKTEKSRQPQDRTLLMEIEVVRLETSACLERLLTTQIRVKMD
jgi:hypothetical protein